MVVRKAMAPSAIRVSVSTVALCAALLPTSTSLSPYPPSSKHLPLLPLLLLSQDIDEKATVLADSAKTFQRSAGAAKRLMRCRYWKMILLFTLLITVVLVIIIVPMVNKNQ